MQVQLPYGTYVVGAIVIDVKQTSTSVPVWQSKQYVCMGYVMINGGLLAITRQRPQSYDRFSFHSGVSPRPISQRSS